jgi:hypothetical protein
MFSKKKVTAASLKAKSAYFQPSKQYCNYSSHFAKRRISLPSSAHFGDWRKIYGIIFI